MGKERETKREKESLGTWSDAHRGQLLLNVSVIFKHSCGVPFSVYEKLDIYILMQNLLHLKGSHERKVLLYRKKIKKANMANFVSIHILL